MAACAAVLAHHTAVLQLPPQRHPTLCCRSDRESSASRMARMAGQTTTSLQDERLEMLNQTVTGAEPSSPCREAARGESPLMFTALLDSNQDTVGAGQGQ